MIKEIAGLIIMGLFLSGCAAVPQRGVPLEEFVHNLSQDLDCLTYCARKETSGKSEFVLKDPLEIHLGITKEGRVSAKPSPNLFSVAGIGFEGGAQQAGDLTLRLHMVDQCEKLALKLKNGEEVWLCDAMMYFDVVGGTEYLYVQGKESKDDPAEVTRRIDVSKLLYLRCVPKVPEGDMPWCHCPKGTGK